MAKKSFDWKPWVIPELAFLGFFVYTLYVIVGDFFLLEAFVMWLLINISIVTCPVVKGCCN